MQGVDESRRSVWCQCQCGEARGGRSGAGRARGACVPRKVVDRYEIASDTMRVSGERGVDGAIREPGTYCIAERGQSGG